MLRPLPPTLHPAVVYNQAAICDSVASTVGSSAKVMSAVCQKSTVCMDVILSLWMEDSQRKKILLQRATLFMRRGRACSHASPFKPLTNLSLAPPLKNCSLQHLFKPARGGLTTSGISFLKTCSFQRKWHQQTTWQLWHTLPSSRGSVCNRINLNSKNSACGWQVQPICRFTLFTGGFSA